MSSGFEVERIDDVVLDGPAQLLASNLMSPFAWQVAGDAGLHVLVRAVPADKDAQKRESGRIWYGASGSDGLVFRMHDAPVLVPGTSDDRHGCEDPTVVPVEDGYVVYYTGVDGNHDGHMLHATGPDMLTLTKRGVALRNSKSERNTKEATLLRSDGVWRLLYEYAHDGHSLIGLTDGDGPSGPWHERADPFGIRPGRWDGFHLSTGPLLRSDPDRPVMFYNGANEDADWGIGWVALTPDLRRAVERGGEPVIGPPAKQDRQGRDIAFAASLVERDGTIWLYYSRNDCQLKRATLRRT